MRQGNTKSTYAFPPVETADENGLLAYGGDLSPERLISAYESGVFPWFESGQPILWWSPPKRMILEPGEIKLSKSMRQLIASQRFEITVDNAFKDVMDRCSKIPRKDQDSTWITESMIRAYSRLHELGFAHSFETRKNGKLVGGLYGVSLGKIFFGESMFHTESNASKFAFYHLHEFALKNEFDFIDCQLYTDHLASLGAHEISREEYMDRLKNALDFPDLQSSWQL